MPSDADTRPVAYIEGLDSDGHLVDNLGRRQPTRFNLVWAFRAVPGMAAQFRREVPGDFWSKDTKEDGTPVAVISCPCGQEPLVEPGRMTECECERFYVHLGNSVRVANSPQLQSAS